MTRKSESFHPSTNQNRPEDKTKQLVSITVKYLEKELCGGGSFNL